MLSFASDYMEGAHEKILDKLRETNLEQLSGYGTDAYCERAKRKIKELCGCAHGEVFFLTGGTQTNQIVIDSMLASYEGVIAAESGHVNVHEAGAIEFTGHKVLALPEHAGKIYGEELREYLKGFYGDENHEHMVFPGMVYISHPTEYGTLYTAGELKEIHEICKEYKLPLYLDGARLGYGLAASRTDVTLPFIAENCDVFYIGGTKTGALIGEAVVFPKGNAPAHFMTIVKQHGALLAKGRLLGIQFDVLFTDDLYFEISAHAIKMAEKLKEGFHKKGYSFAIDSPTNQQFVILSNKQMEELSKQVSFGFWEKQDEEHAVVRFATSWATREEDVEKLLSII